MLLRKIFLNLVKIGLFFVSPAHSNSFIRNILGNILPSYLTESPQNNIMNTNEQINLYYMIDTRNFFTYEIHLHVNTLINESMRMNVNAGFKNLTYISEPTISTWVCGYSWHPGTWRSSGYERVMVAFFLLQTAKIITL